MDKNISKKTNNTKNRSIIILTIIFSFLIVFDLLFLVLTGSVVRSALLIKNEFILLDQDKKIVSASEDLETQYGKEILAISKVFPNEEDLPDFFDRLEKLIKIYADSGTIRFNSLVPIKEQDKLFLLLSLSLKTDLERLNNLFTEFELLPYMTHITGVQAKTPGKFSGNSDINVLVKVYVQNPFTTK